MGDGRDVPGAAAARGLDLERAYVHDVYEHAEHEPDEGSCPRAPSERQEKIVSFLSDLEPGSLVCDVGCGSGKYLNVKPSVFSLGADRCSRLAVQASDAGSEVVVCDNLALPYRDDCFDAVVSAAVVHHFATTERRARALRELARVLRIGGRVLVTVWAMEQKGRRFESQDVLVPWHRPQTLCAPSPGLPRRDESPEERRRRERFTNSKETKYQQFLSTVSDSEMHSECELKCRQRGCSMDASRAALYSPGHSSLSSLSSPNETCYSFVRRAIQKLAGSKRSTRPWFLESWSYSKQEQTRYDPDGSEDLDSDIRDLPIELRRIDNEEEPLKRQTFNCPDLSSELYVAHKSKSLSDILAVEDKSLVRSRSSIPSMGGSFGESGISEPVVEEHKNNSFEQRSKPKLVKQKKSINEEDAEEDLDKPTDMKSLVEDLPTFKVSTHRLSRKLGDIQQTSLNEELMSTERLREKEHLRKNIQKQASLNEEILSRGYGTLDSLRDSFISTSANTAKKFQSLKNGLTNKFKTSTTNMEKVTVIGFVKMFQGWKSHDMPPTTSCDTGPTTPQSDGKYSDREDKISTERRHSKEDGSDSSKDSSLQSDTSVDSEDSFASVIYIPKIDTNNSQEPLSPAPLSPGPTSPRLKVSSVPTSPRIKSAPGLPSPRLKQVFPILRPPLSPKTTQAPLQVNKILLTQYSLKNNMSTNVIKDSNDTLPFLTKTKSPPTSPPKLSDETAKIPLARPDSKISVSAIEGMGILNTVEEESDFTSQQLIDEINKDIEEIHKLTAETENIAPRILQDLKPYPKITLQTVAELPEIPQYRGGKNYTPNDTLDFRGIDRKRRERVKQVRDLLKQGFVTTNTKTIFPIVRRQVGKTESIARTHPTLLSLEVFNPETDDPDSDSSGASSPDSVDSVISVVLDETRRLSSEKEYPMKNNSDTKKTLLSPIKAAVEVPTSLEGIKKDTTSQPQTSPHAANKPSDTSDCQALLQGASGSSSNGSLNRLSPGDLRLLEERSRSHTSSSGSTSSLERLSPGRRSKERSPKRSSNGNSTLSLNRLSPSKQDRSFEENVHKRSPTRFPYDCMTTSSTESDKSISKSESFTRLQAEEKLVTCKSDIVSTEDEIEWKDNNQQHLTEFAEKLSEKLLHEIDQYSKRINEEDFDIPNSSGSEASASFMLRRKREDEQTQKVLDDLSGSLQDLDDAYVNKINVDIKGMSKLSDDLQERNKYIASLKQTDSNELIDLFPKCCTKVKTEKEAPKNKSGKSQFTEDGLAKKSIRIADKQNNNNNNPFTVPNKILINDQDKIETDADVNARTPTGNTCPFNGNPEITVDSDNKSEFSQSLETGCSIESEISVDSFCTDKRSSLRVGHSTDSSEVEKMEISPESLTSRSSATGSNTSTSTAPLRSGFSIESSEAGDTSVSGSDWSRRDPSLGTAKTGSLASLGASVASLPGCYDMAWSGPTRPPARLLADGRSSSEESKTRAPLAPTPRHLLEPSLSDTSQDSLPSEGAGGAVTFHRYYHVFREGELNQLIEKYVENLHIISSFYDHSSWCVIAEKVQVWTI